MPYKIDRSLPLSAFASTLPTILHIKLSIAQSVHVSQTRQGAFADVLSVDNYGDYCFFSLEAAAMSTLPILHQSPGAVFHGIVNREIDETSSARYCHTKGFNCSGSAYKIEKMERSQWIEA